MEAKNKKVAHKFPLLYWSLESSTQGAAMVEEPYMAKVVVISDLYMGQRCHQDITHGPQNYSEVQFWKLFENWLVSVPFYTDATQTSDRFLGQGCLPL